MDDLEFVQRCLSRHTATWDEFLNKYARLIYKYIYSVLKVKGSTLTQDHVEDIFQDILVSLIKDDFRKLRSFKAKNGCSLASWLRQVTVNFTLSYLRRLKSPISLDQEAEGHFSLKDSLTDDSPLASETLLDKERLNLLRDCIGRLSSDDQYFLELHLNRGIRLEELGELLSLSRGALDMQKMRIVDRLRDCFKDKGFAVFYR
ncbi:MAG: sigma-70 family RNA polymerase sigma factor [Candidatus Omnitrophota bacterium]